MRALDVASRLDVPEVFDLLVDALGDSSARVASGAATTLASRPGDGVTDALLATFAAGLPVDRRAAYAILAIVEREDLQGVAIFGESDVDPLLARLALEDELASGAAACALAGIGFRSSTLGDVGWLDLLVPHHLVRAVSAVAYHKDFVPVEELAATKIVDAFGWWRGRDLPRRSQRQKWRS